MGQFLDQILELGGLLANGLTQGFEAVSRDAPWCHCGGHSALMHSHAGFDVLDFEIDLEHCPNCGGELKIIAAIFEQPVIVSNIDDTNLERLRYAGATKVAPEAIKGSLMLAEQALALVGVPMARVTRVTHDARDARYHLLRGDHHGAVDDTIEE